MELIGDLKKLVESAKNRDEIKSIIEDAGMKLTDDELDMVAGGGGIHVGVMVPGTHHYLADDLEERARWDALSSEERQRAMAARIEI